MNLFLRKILFFVFILIGIFVLAEITYRLKLRYSKADYENSKIMHKTFRYSDNPDLLVELMPNVVSVMDNVTVRTNKYGYRDDEWDNDSTKIRILFLSDSVGFPLKINHENGFEYLIEHILKTKYNLNVELLNISCLGYNAIQHIENIKKFDSVCKGIIKYDYILQNITQDDAQPTGKPSPLEWINAPNSPYKWIPSKLILRIIDLYYYKNIQPKLYSEKYLYSLFNYLKTKQDKGIKVRAFTIPVFKKSYNKYIKQLEVYNRNNTKLNYNFLDDSFDKLNESDRKSMYYKNDNTHLSIKGHQFVAEEMAKIIFEDLNYKVK